MPGDEITYGVIAIWLMVCVILVVAFRVYPRKPKIDYKAIARDMIAAELPEFKVSRVILRSGQAKQDKNKIHGIAVDDESERFCLISDSKPQPFDFPELIEAQLIVAGETKATHSRLVKFAGTPVGDVIIDAYDRFGEPKPEAVKFLGIAISDPNKPAKPKKNFFGQIIEEKDTNVNLRVVVHDDEAPFRTFAFVEQEEPDDDQFKAAQKAGEVWFEQMKKIMKKADEDNPEPDEKAKCIADEIIKLVGLKHDGILTEEEFTNLKNRLVGVEPS